MRTPASVKHHPLHPILVTFPIALWIYSLASDIIALTRLGRPELWSQIAFYSMAAGIVGALLAAVPGFIDWLSINDPKLKRIGLIHMLLNLFVVGIFVINWAIRLNYTTDLLWPFILSVVGIVVMSIAGWIGANLVHEYRVGVEEPPSQMRPA